MIHREKISEKNHKNISTAEWNNVVSRRPVEERRISPRGRKTSHLVARMKKDVSHRAVEERRI